MKNLNDRPACPPSPLDADNVLEGSLSVISYNVNTSKDGVMASFLRDDRVLDYDIVAIQEPWQNPFCFTTHHPAKQHFWLIWPESKPRVCFFVNKRIPKSRVSYNTSGRDIMWINITIDESPRTVTRIINLYVDRNEPHCKVLAEAADQV